MSIPDNTILSELQKLDGGDPVESAEYRQHAQEMLADSEVSLNTKTAIADILGEANQQLTLKTVRTDESY